MRFAKFPHTPSQSCSRKKINFFIFQIYFVMGCGEFCFAKSRNAQTNGMTGGKIAIFFWHFKRVLFGNGKCDSTTDHPLQVVHFCTKKTTSCQKYLDFCSQKSYFLFFKIAFDERRSFVKIVVSRFVFCQHKMLAAVVINWKKDATKKFRFLIPKV